MNSILNLSFSTLSLQGLAVVAARATRLPIYSSFAKEGNLSDLFAKGEAISTLFNVVGLGAGIFLASTVCSSMQGKVQSLMNALFPKFQNSGINFTDISGSYLLFFLI